MEHGHFNIYEAWMLQDDNDDDFHDFLSNMLSCVFNILICILLSGELRCCNYLLPQGQLLCYHVYLLLATKSFLVN